MTKYLYLYKWSVTITKITKERFPCSFKAEENNNVITVFILTWLGISCYYRPQQLLWEGNVFTSVVKGRMCGKDRGMVGVCVARRWGGACVQERWLLKRAVRILLECILVIWNSDNTSCSCSLKSEIAILVWQRQDTFLLLVSAGDKKESTKITFYHWNMQPRSVKERKELQNKMTKDHWKETFLICPVFRI